MYANSKTFACPVKSGKDPPPHTAAAQNHEHWACYARASCIRRADESLYIGRPWSFGAVVLNLQAQAVSVATHEAESRGKGVVAHRDTKKDRLGADAFALPPSAGRRRA